jgi:hypothetical protein
MRDNVVARVGEDQGARRAIHKRRTGVWLDLPHVALSHFRADRVSVMSLALAVAKLQLRARPSRVRVLGTGDVECVTFADAGEAVGSSPRFGDWTTWAHRR